jgi:hypothetical protein
VAALPQVSAALPTGQPPVPRARRDLRAAGRALGRCPADIPAFAWERWLAVLEGGGYVIDRGDVLTLDDDPWA